jgi:hypothetical protein
MPASFEVPVRGNAAEVRVVDRARVVPTAAVLRRSTLSGDRQISIDED